jgi:RNA polymerase sigma factor (TIGR02999 family)
MDDSTSRLIEAAQSGDSTALGELFERVYAELKFQAHKERRHSPANTLGTTGLVHEAYLRLLQSGQIRSDNRQHFLSLAAKAMRHIAIDHARAKLADKRGGAQRQMVDLDLAVDIVDAEPGPEKLLQLEEALIQLEAEEPRLAQLVELRFFGGLPIEEIAEMQGISERTLHRDWRRARAQLYEILHPDAGA